MAAEPKVEVWYLLFDREKRTALGQASFVELSPDATVARMKEQIKEKQSVTLMHVDASMLIVWRCKDSSVDFGRIGPSYRNQKLNKVFSREQEELEWLDPKQKVGQLDGTLLIEVPGESFSRVLRHSVVDRSIPLLIGHNWLLVPVSTVVEKSSSFHRFKGTNNPSSK